MQNDNAVNRSKLLKILDTGVTKLAEYLEDVEEATDYSRELLNGIKSLLSIQNWHIN